MDFKRIWREYCREDPQSWECERAVVDYIQDAESENRVRARTHGDHVDVMISEGETEISARFPIVEDRGRAHVDLEGTAMVENQETDEYMIVEDVPVESDIFYDDLPDVDQQRRDAAQERRDRNRDFRRSVL